MEHREEICKIILISHGELAKGMQDSVQLLLGKQKHLTAYSLQPKQRVEELVDLLKKEVHMYASPRWILTESAVKSSGRRPAALWMCEDFSPKRCRKRLRKKNKENARHRFHLSGS